VVGDRHCFTLGVLGASLFYVYDSLIEKCCTVSGSERQRGPQCLLLFKLSVGAERASGHALYH
jgi:hypothetical protein